MLSKEEILEKFKKCNEERTRLKKTMDSIPSENRYYRSLELEIAFNNGQMNIIRELIE